MTRDSSDRSTVLTQAIADVVTRTPSHEHANQTDRRADTDTATVSGSTDTCTVSHSVRLASPNVQRSASMIGGCAEHSPLATSRRWICYLLLSHHPSPRFKGTTYIGYTEHFHVRMAQHKSGRGGKGTTGKGPWSLVATVTGFPTGMMATTFEWMWQEKQTAAAWARQFLDVRQKTGKERKLLLARYLLQHTAFAHHALLLHTHADSCML
jgi:predicted GIY-YIG superfamily endonuclease